MATLNEIIVAAKAMGLRYEVNVLEEDGDKWARVEVGVVYNPRTYNKWAWFESAGFESVEDVMNSAAYFVQDYNAGTGVATKRWKRGAQILRMLGL